MKFKLVMILSTCLFFAALHAGDMPVELETCKQVCDAFIKEVSTTLHNDMLTNGVIGTVPTCAEKIDKICNKFSKHPGVTLERTTLLRLKEQERSHSLEAEMLRHMIETANTEKAVTEDHKWLESENSGKAFIYVRAIKVEPLCLSCHGPSEIVQPNVKKLMMSKYKALPSGNQLGEIKGAIVISLKFPEAESYVKDLQTKQTKEENKSDEQKQ